MFDLKLRKNRQECDGVLDFEQAGVETARPCQCTTRFWHAGQHPLDVRRERGDADQGCDPY